MATGAVSLDIVVFATDAHAASAGAAELDCQSDVSTGKARSSAVEGDTVMDLTSVALPGEGISTKKRRRMKSKP